MAPPAFQRPISRPHGRGELLQPIRVVSRAVLPRLSHARRLAALTALALSAPTNARSRRNALRSAQEMAQHRRPRPGTDPDRMDVPQGAHEAGRSS